MKRTPSLAIFSALFLAAAARAQSSTPPAPQPAIPYNALDNDPAFKRLPPEQQEMVRKIMENTKAAIDAERSKPIPSSKTTAPAIPPMKPAPPAQSTGCAVAPVKTPKFHIPKALQDAVNKQVKQVGKQTGVDLDPNAPSQAVKDAQKNIPCPPVTPAAGQPAANK